MQGSLRQQMVAAGAICRPTPASVANWRPAAALGCCRRRTSPRPP